MRIPLRQDAEVAPDLSDHRKLLGMASAYWQSQAIYALVRTGIAEVLGDEPSTAEKIAFAAGCDADSVARLLRYLAGLGIVGDSGSDGYTSTSIVDHVRHGSPFRELVLMFGDEFYEAWGSFSATVRTGRSSYFEAYGLELFDYMRASPEKAARFDIAMEATTGLIAEQLARTVDFSAVGRVIDIGGGNGALLEAVLRSAPAAEGLNIDVDHVVASCLDRVKGTDLQGRLSAASGDFFTSIPGGGGVYVLSRILHDWPDQDCVRILSVCRAAIADDTPLLVLERLLPDAPKPALASSFDLNMMAVTGGRERTREQFAELLAEGGFRLDSVHPLPFETGLLIAYPG